MNNMSTKSQRSIPYSKFKHGQRVTCEINGIKVECKIGICNEGYVYLCSDNDSLISDDFRAFGYTNSFSFLRKNEDYFYGKTQYIKNLKFFPRTIDDLEEGDVVLNPYGGARKVLGICGSVVLLSAIANTNSYSFQVTKYDLKEDGYTIKQDEPANIDIRTPTESELVEDKLELRSPEVEKMREESRATRFEFVPKNGEVAYYYDHGRRLVFEINYSGGFLMDWHNGFIKRTERECKAHAEKYARYFLTE